MAVKSERKDHQGGSAIRLDRTYLHLEDGAGVTAVPVDDAFWATSTAARTCRTAAW